MRISAFPKRLEPRDYQGKRVNLPHGSLTKVIPLKLFLDIVTSSSTDFTRVLRGQPKRLSRNYRSRNGGNVFVNVLISFHSRDVLCTLSRLLVRQGFRLFCAKRKMRCSLVCARLAVQ